MKLDHFHKDQGTIQKANLWDSPQQKAQKDLIPTKSVFFQKQALLKLPDNKMYCLLFTYILCTFFGVNVDKYTNLTECFGIRDLFLVEQRSASWQGDCRCESSRSLLLVPRRWLRSGPHALCQKWLKGSSVWATTQLVACEFFEKFEKSGLSKPQPVAVGEIGFKKDPGIWSFDGESTPKQDEGAWIWNMEFGRNLH